MAMAKARDYAGPAHLAWPWPWSFLLPYSNRLYLKPWPWPSHYPKLRLMPDL
ncbi:hypothetical protein M885DRAFT_568072 [Pelagophyceae sp. CCMP2097]|nr:hypothetical protein M885DRAFT_568072 [Pelagophyceae sp. CCMP2097]